MQQGLGGGGIGLRGLIRLGLFGHYGLGGGKFLGWRPWHYEGDRKIQKAVKVTGGLAESGAKISGWSAEMFVPYKLLEPLQNVPPKPGTAWRANFYRVDVDGGKGASWDWARVGPSFHEYQKFGTLIFDE